MDLVSTHEISFEPTSRQLKFYDRYKHKRGRFYNAGTDLKSIEDLLLLSDLKILRITYNSPCNGLNCLNRFELLEDLSLYKCGLDNSKLKYIAKCTGLKRLDIQRNTFTTVKKLGQLVNLDYLSAHKNPIRSLEGLQSCSKLKFLDVDETLIESLYPLRDLPCLETISASYCKNLRLLHGIPKSAREVFVDYCKVDLLDGLENCENLVNLSVRNNRLQTIPNLRLWCPRLQKVDFNFNSQIVYIHPSMMRLMDLMKRETAYTSNQSIHNSTVQKSFRQSCANLVIDPTFHISQILTDSEIPDRIKLIIVQYCQDKTKHSVLLLTFEEVLSAVWNRIVSHKDASELKKRLSEELHESTGMCYTGRLTRLVNCLVGYYDDIKIQVSSLDQAYAILARCRDLYDTVEQQKSEAEKLLRELEFEDLDTLLSYLD